MRKLIILLTLLIVISISYATIINIPDDYTTIQEGINASVNGDTVLIDDGTYNVNNLSVTDKSITIKSQNSYNNTIIDGSSQYKILTVTNSNDKIFTIDGFTIRNGDAQYNLGDVIEATGGLNYLKILTIKNVKNLIFSKKSSKLRFYSI